MGKWIWCTVVSSAKNMQHGAQNHQPACAEAIHQHPRGSHDRGWPARPPGRGRRYRRGESQIVLDVGRDVGHHRENAERYQGGVEKRDARDRIEQLHLRPVRACRCQVAPHGRHQPDCSQSEQSRARPPRRRARQPNLSASSSPAGTQHRGHRERSHHRPHGLAASLGRDGVSDDGERQRRGQAAEAARDDAGEQRHRPVAKPPARCRPPAPAC